MHFPVFVGFVCATWPENALRANIYAQISLALNRVYTEWYPSKGYNFNITNSTQYDQYYVKGRNIFTNISRIVDEIFNTYLRRVGDFAPYYAEYCNGTTVTCNGMSQWGTVSLAQSGLSPIQILRRYYGSNFELVTTNNIRAITSSYPGTPLRVGSTGSAVRTIQRQLNRIAQNYPSIGQQAVDGVFGTGTQNAVRTFQRIFNLTADGVVGKATWYKISYIYVSVKRLAELTSEKEPYPEGSGSTQPGVQGGFGNLSVGNTGAQVAAVQYFLSYLAQTFYPSIPNITPDGIFGTATRQAVIAFQNQFNLTADGIVGSATWSALNSRFTSAYEDNNPGSFFGAYPGIVLRQGSRGLRVQQAQFYLLYLHYSYSSIPRISADGIFGSATAAAVRAFQAIAGLTRDGVIGLATWTQLYSYYSQQKNRILLDNQTGEYPGYVLARGSIGISVLQIQNYLRVISRKFSMIPPVTSTSQYGERTVRSVRAFQGQFDLPATGRVDETTWDRIGLEYTDVLETEHLECRFLDVAYPGIPITLNQSNIFVRMALYYYNMVAAFNQLLRPIPITEQYTREAMLAIREFQLVNDLPVTGIINADTWNTLYTQYVAAYSETYPECMEEGKLPAPFSTLTVGSRGIYVTQLQVWLNTLSAFYCDMEPQRVTGVYGETTESNVYILQELLDLPLTGEVDRATWKLIREAYLDAIREPQCRGV